MKIESIDGGKALLISDAASKLQKAEEELQASNARMRSLNAVSVNVETGWTRKDDALLTISSGDAQLLWQSVGRRAAWVQWARRAAATRKRRSRRALRR